MPALVGILARQHWEAWLLSLYVLLAGDEALQAITGDDIYWKRRLSKAFRLGRDDYRTDSAEPARLNYKELHDRLLVLLREREPVDGRPVGVTGYDVTYRYESLVSVHANLTTIGGHLVCRDDGWAVSVDSSQTADDVVLTPALNTVHLAQYVFKEFGLDGDAMDPFVADLVVPARAQKQEAN